MIDKKIEILKAGRALFAEKGFKDTNVAKISKLAGIATGTFYNYYSSKDKLFMDIFLEENIKLKKHIMLEVDLDSDPIDVMKMMMALNEEGMRNNPILKEWYNHDVCDRIVKIYNVENGVEKVNLIYDIFIDVVRKWQGEEVMRSDINAEMIMAMFSALINIDAHKDEIGVQYFPSLLDYFAEFIMKGLMNY